jgi:Protein of unknown function (DUF3152)
MAKPDRVDIEPRPGDAGVVRRPSRRIGSRIPRERRPRRRRGWRTNLPAVLLVAAIVGGVGVGYLDHFDSAGSTARTASGARAPAAADGTTEIESLQALTPRVSSVVNPAPAPPVQVPEQGSGRLGVVTVLAAAPPGPDESTADVQVMRYIVEVEEEVAADRPAFAAAVNATLNDSRSWAAEGRRFVQVADGPVDFRVTLATPSTVDQLCLPLVTGGTLSCWDGERAMLNAVRWYNGADAYAGDLDSYRLYLVNHEVGHGLGQRHQDCPRAGALAPVMMQQTKGVGSCLANPWPYP